MYKRQNYSQAFRPLDTDLVHHGSVSLEQSVGGVEHKMEPNQRVQELDAELDRLHDRLTRPLCGRVTSVAQAFRMGRSQSLFVAAARDLSCSTDSAKGRRTSEQSAHSLAGRSNSTSPLPRIPRSDHNDLSHSFPMTNVTSDSPSALRRRSRQGGLHASVSQPELSTTRMYGSFCHVSSQESGPSSPITTMLVRPALPRSRRDV